MGLIMLTALFLIIFAEIFVSQPLADHIHSRGISDIKATSESIVFGIFLPLAVAVIYTLAKRKKNKTAER
jgi:ABC-type thiamin/hydroxymethylpyrimidine transport system permease subunit